VNEVAAPSRGTTSGARVRALLKRAAGLEKHLYASIGRAILRRPAIPPGARGFRYDSSTLPLLVVFIFVSAIEVVAIDLIVHRWPPVRIAFLVIGVWGLIWMIGLLCAHVMRPHTVGPEGVRIRDGLDLDLAIAWDDVHAVAIRKHSPAAKPPRLIEGDGTRTLVIAVSSATNLEITLEGPTAVRLPGGPPTGGHQQITAIRLWADDPKAYLTEVKKHIAGAPDTASRVAPPTRGQVSHDAPTSGE